jgi:uncharacterized protein YlaI
MNDHYEKNGREIFCFVCDRLNTEYLVLAEGWPVTLYICSACLERPELSEENRIKFLNDEFQRQYHCPPK